MVVNLAVLFFSAALAAPTPCGNLKSISLPNTTITMAQSVPAETFTPPAGAGQGGGQPATTPVPAFCRVGAILRPNSDSEIEMEVWLPETWNGKFQFVGGGGWVGVISYPALVTGKHEG